MLGSGLFKNAMEGVFDLGGLESRNLQQLVHSCYALLTPRGGLRTKYLLETIDALNKILDSSRHDRAAYRRDLADIYKSPALRYTDLRIAKKMDIIRDKMDIQRAPNAIEREEGVDVTPLMAGKLMLHNLRAGPHKVNLIEELRLRDANVATQWKKLCKMMKTATKHEESPS
jgi:hypothetical protein